MRGTPFSISRWYQAGRRVNCRDWNSFLPSDPKPLALNRRIPAQPLRIELLAKQTGLASAQRWFMRERAWINERQLQLCRIGAPTFLEQRCAEWFRDQLTALGWHATLDRAGNVIARFRATGGNPSLVLSAHLDTVLAPNRAEDIHFSPDGRLCGPGVSDNGSGLAALIAFARLLHETSELHELASSLLLVANVGEEGEGNLNGMRYLCRQLLSNGSRSALRAFIVLDGPSVDHITAQALASRRFEIVFSGPGGHSWNDYGTPNPVHALADAVSRFVEAAEARTAAQQNVRCSYNFGLIEGGMSINSIAATARAKLDVRSEDASIFDDLLGLLSAAVERGLERENRRATTVRLSAKVSELGSRPGGKLADESPLLRTVQAVDSHLHIRSRIHCASTDANIPLSLGAPAVSIGTGGQGGGAHTPQEWYQPEGRELGLKRILLVLAALAEENGNHRQSAGPAEQ